MEIGAAWLLAVQRSIGMTAHSAFFVVRSPSLLTQIESLGRRMIADSSAGAFALSMMSIMGQTVNNGATNLHELAPLHM
jgi:hypothetical protein